MDIEIVTGAGFGRTAISAFDSALIDAGIHNYNLILLSSVIPANSKILRVHRRGERLNEYGHRLYVVTSHSTTNIVGETAVAGIGWKQRKDDNCGLFVEIHGNDVNQVQKEITMNLEGMVSNRLELGFEESINSEIKFVNCEYSHQYVCALVAAVYKSEDWGHG